MRAISEAKSIDDMSDTMAETLFGDAELDLMSALATAASLAEDDEAATPAAPKASTPKTPAPRPAPKPSTAAKPAAAKNTASDDDLIALLGLSDAPLELIDDPTPSPADRQKSANRR